MMTTPLPIRGNFESPDLDGRAFLTSFHGFVVRTAPSHIGSLLRFIHPILNREITYTFCFSYSTAA